MYNEEQEIQRMAELIGKSLTEQLSDEESEELARWIARSDANRRLMERIKDPVYYDERHVRFQETAYPDGWSEFMTRVDARKNRRIAPLRLIWRYAAAIAVVVAAAWGVSDVLDDDVTDSAEAIAAITPGSSQAILELENGTRVALSADVRQTIPALQQRGIQNSEAEIVYPGDPAAETEKNFEKRAEQPPVHSLIVPRGGEYKLVLPDGTTVWLNSESVLRYPIRFNGAERRVILEGEGYFDVAKNENFPFVVETAGVDITVLGTEFNVMSYPDSRNVETTLVSGRVNVVAEGCNVDLQPGRQALYDRETASVDVREVNTSIYTSWKDGVFEFDAMPLKDICKLLGRWYNVDIVFSDPRLESYTFTGAVRKDKSLKFILDIISDTRHISYEMSDGRIVLNRKRTKTRE